MKPTRYFRNLKLVVKPVSHEKTLYMLTYIKDRRLWPSGVKPIGSECLAFADGSNVPIMGGFAAANTECEANKRARFYTKQGLNKWMKKRKPVIRQTPKGTYEATIYHQGAYHHGYGETMEEAVELAIFNKNNFFKVLDEIIENVEPFKEENETPAKHWWQFWNWFKSLDDGCDKYH